LAYVDGRVRVRTRTGRQVADCVPELTGRVDALDGQDLTDRPLVDRKRLLDGLHLMGPAWITNGWYPGEGATLFQAAQPTTRPFSSWRSSPTCPTVSESMSSTCVTPSPPEMSVAISVIDLADGEVLGAGPMTIRVLEDGTHTNHRLGIIEITIPPRVDGPPQHVHSDHDETFYVVSGAPTFTSGPDIIHTKPGMLVTAPPGTPHTFANPGDDPAVMLCTLTPDLYIGYFRELAAQPPGPLDHAIVAGIMSRYSTQATDHA
jgi:mannose-6-phosphate isomerase-like protein (cupin superfamily)